MLGAERSNAAGWSLTCAASYRTVDIDRNVLDLGRIAETQERWTYGVGFCARRGLASSALVVVGANANVASCRSKGETCSVVVAGVGGCARVRRLAVRSEVLVRAAAEPRTVSVVRERAVVDARLEDG